MMSMRLCYGKLFASPLKVLPKHILHSVLDVQMSFVEQCQFK